MAENSSRERDLVLAPNEYAFISDQTKGHIIVYVGPCKTSLANTDQPVFFNDQTKRFDRCLLEQAISPFAIAPEGWYIVLKNPAKDIPFAMAVGVLPVTLLYVAANFAYLAVLPAEGIANAPQDRVVTAALQARSGCR